MEKQAKDTIDPQEFDTLKEFIGANVVRGDLSKARNKNTGRVSLRRIMDMKSMDRMTDKDFEFFFNMVRIIKDRKRKRENTIKELLS